MAGESTSKVIGVKWEVDTTQLERCEKLSRGFILTIKKLNQVHGELAEQTDVLTQSYTQAAGAAQRQTQMTQQLLLSEEKSSEVLARQNMAIMQTLAAIQQNTTAQNENKQSTDKLNLAKLENNKVLNINAEEWLRNARTLVFWTVGAASTYRLIIKIRREIIETVKALVENTEEYERLTKSVNILKAALLNIVGPQETWRKILDVAAKSIEAVGLAYAGFISVTAGLLAGLVEVYEDVERAANRLALQVAEWQGNEAVIRAINKRMEEMGEDITVADAIAQGFERTWKNIGQTFQIISGQEKPWEAPDMGKVKSAWEGITDIIKRYNTFMEDLVDAEQRRVEDLSDLWRDYQRRLEDIATDVRRAMEDLTLKGTRRREDIEIDYQRRLQDIEAQAQDNRASAEEKYRIRLIQIEMRYREQLIRIEENFQDAMYDAIAQRDATAALKAMRVRERDTARAKRERDDARELARLDYESQINDQERALRRMREDAQKARQRALEDLARDMERERQDILLDQQRKLEDLELYWSRRRAEIETEYAKEIVAARDHYFKDETEYGNHLTRKLQALQNYYRQVATLHATYASISAAGATGVVGTGGGGGVQQFAEGGAMVASGPTNISVAERAPEIIVAQPLMPTSYTFSGSMRHSVYGQVEAMFAGMEGRLGAAVTQQVLQVFRDVFQ